MASLFDSIELPSMPQVVSRILEINENDIDISVSQLEVIISSDPNLVGKIIKLANSPFYSRSKHIADLGQALNLLGFKSIKSLTLLISIARIIPNLDNSEYQKELWMRSIITAVLCKNIAIMCSARNIAESVFLAGLLRGMGQLMLHSRFPTIYENILADSSAGVSMEKRNEMEKNTFGNTAEDLTHHIMDKWNFPTELSKPALVSKNETFDENDPIAKSEAIVSLSESILIYRKFTKMIPEDPKLHEESKEQIEKLTGILKLNDKQKNTIESGIEKTFQEDDFYAFCDEIFSL